MNEQSSIDTQAWLLVASCDGIDEEDVIRFDHGEHTYAVYNVAGKFYVTDGICPHENQHLAEGLVDDDVITCPLHLAEFNIKTGKAISGPVCTSLKTYEVMVSDGNVYIRT